MSRIGERRSCPSERPAQGAFQFFLRFAGGVIGDRSGEQNVLKAGFTGMFIGALMFALTEAFWSLVIAQLFMGLSRALYNPASQSYVTRISEHDRARIVGRYHAAQTLGMAVGPPLVGAIVLLSTFRAGFLLIAAVEAAGLALTFFLPDIPRRTARTMREAVAPLPSMVRSKPLFLAGLVTAGTAFNPAVAFTLMFPFLAGNGVTVFENGILTTAFMLAGVGTGLVFSRLMGWLGPVRLTMLDLAGGGLGLMLIAVTGSMPLVLLVMPLWGIFHAIGSSMRFVLTAQYSAPEQRGIAAGYTGSYWALVQFVAPLGLGLLATAVGVQTAMVAVAIAWMASSTAVPLLFRALAPRPTQDAMAEAEA